MQRWSTMLLVVAVLGAGCSTAREAADEAEETGEEVAEEIGIREEDNTLAGRVAHSGDFETLEQLIRQADLVETLQQEGPYTLFAPTDDAFEALPEEQREGMMKSENQEELRALLLSHVVEGRLSGDEVRERRSLETLRGNTLRVQRRGGNLYVGGAQVEETDREAENGVMHAIGRVIR